MRIIPRPEVTAVHAEHSPHASVHQILCKKISYDQCVDVAVPKLTSVEDNRLETDVRPASSGMDAIGRHDVLREPSVMIGVKTSCLAGTLLRSSASG
jgi:hypothetical protein